MTAAAAAAAVEAKDEVLPAADSPAKHIFISQRSLGKWL
jgi:hypothetical protein